MNAWHVSSDITYSICIVRDSVVGLPTCLGREALASAGESPTGSAVPVTNTAHSIPAAKRSAVRVVLIHGLARTPLSLFILMRRLRRHGFATEHFGYAAFVEPYERIVRRLRRRLRSVQAEPYAVVAHSLGGVLVRSALGPGDIGLPVHVIMLGTPNRRPLLAPRARRVAPWRWWTGECGALLASEDFYDRLPPLRSPYTLIAGTGGARGRWSPFRHEPNDGLVAVDETRLHDGDRALEFPVRHTFIMNSTAVQQAVVAALKTARDGA